MPVNSGGNEAAVKVTYEGHDYDFDLLGISTEELREIKRKLELTPAKFLSGIAEADVEAMLGLKWLILRSDGQHDDLVLNAKDPFTDYWQFLQAWNAGEEAEPEPDPTAAGTLPATPTPESSGSSQPIPSSSAATTPSPSPVTAESLSGTSDVSPSPDSSVTSPA